jgi:hypothetical protein
MEFALREFHMCTLLRREHAPGSSRRPRIAIIGLAFNGFPASRVPSWRSQLLTAPFFVGNTPPVRAVVPGLRLSVWLLTDFRPLVFRVGEANS